MRNLLLLFVRYSRWFVFLLLEVICFVLIFNFNQHHWNVFLTSVNTVSGTVYKCTGFLNEYFHLRTDNHDLLDRNLRMEMEMERMRAAFKTQASLLDSLPAEHTQEDIEEAYTILPAHVINNSVAHRDNYITIDKGERDGVRTEMGVISNQGVVGIVYLTSAHYSLVLPILNSKSNISCKLKHSDYFGVLTWDGASSQYADLTDMPLHANVSVGDTILTSGYSAMFPPGLHVGTVNQASDQVDALSYLIKVKLFVDFGNISDVRIIARKGSEEQLELEKQIDR